MNGKIPATDHDCMCINMIPSSTRITRSKLPPLQGTWTGSTTQPTTQTKASQTFLLSAKRFLPSQTAYSVKKEILRGKEADSCAVQSSIQKRTIVKKVKDGSVQAEWATAICRQRIRSGNCRYRLIRGWTIENDRGCPSQTRRHTSPKEKAKDATR